MFINNLPGYFLLSVFLLCASLLSCSDTSEKVRVNGINMLATPKVHINTDICHGCFGEFCKNLCPHQAVKKDTIDNRYIFIIDPEKCIRCGICIEKCPFGAIGWEH